MFQLKDMKSFSKVLPCSLLRLLQDYCSLNSEMSYCVLPATQLSMHNAGGFDGLSYDWANPQPTSPYHKGVGDLTSSLQLSEPFMVIFGPNQRF